MGSFTDHAANERTFLAWLRTAIAVVVFGFVVEKFNLFISAIGSTNSELGKMIRVDRVLGPLGHYEGFALMVTGIILIIVSYFWFTRNKRMIDNADTVTSGLNHLKCRVQAFQLDACVCGRKAPVGLGMVDVAPREPSFDFALERLPVWDAPVETLT